MKQSSPPLVPAPAPRGFVTTRWSLVLAAGKEAAPEARVAFSELYALYRHPLYDFIRRQGLPAEEAKDLIQGFFARLLEKNDLAVMAPTRGRFRRWLLAAVRHYLANEWDREQAKKRGGNLIRIDLEDAEEYFSQGLAHGLTPERAFDRCWAERLLKNVLEALGKEYEGDDRRPLFDQLKNMLTGVEEDSYPRIAERLGKTPGAVRVAALRLRQRFGALLLQEVSHTVENPEDVDDELRFLISAFEDV